MKKQLISFTLIATGFLIGATALSALAQTWTPPTSAPPNGNISAPILTDTSVNHASNQNRYGLLGLANLVVTNLNVASGTPATGKVLTSDSAGDASWANTVSQITAGTNITISPSGGTGNVTVNTPTPTLIVTHTSNVSGSASLGAATCPSGQVVNGVTSVDCSANGNGSACTWTVSCASVTATN